MNMANIKRFKNFINEEWFWDKKKEEPAQEEPQGTEEFDHEIEEQPHAGGGKLIAVGQEDWKDWGRIIPKYKEFEQVTFVVDENTEMDIYNPTIVFLSKNPNKPDFSNPGDENVSIRYDKKDNPHIKEAVLQKMEQDGIIERRHFMSLIKPEFIGMHCGNLNSVVVK